MGKINIKWTNHKDPKRVGRTDQVEESRARQLVREGLAVEADAAGRRKPAPSKPKADDADGAASK